MSAYLCFIVASTAQLSASSNLHRHSPSSAISIPIRLSLFHLHNNASNAFTFWPKGYISQPLSRRRAKEIQALTFFTGTLIQVRFLFCSLPICRMRIDYDKYNVRLIVKVPYMKGCYYGASEYDELPVCHNEVLYNSLSKRGVINLQQLLGLSSANLQSIVGNSVASKLYQVVVSISKRSS